MPHDLTVSLSPGDLDSGSPEERATFGLLALTANDRLLTQGIDTDSGMVRDGPYVPGYPLAEWLAWNWWRIRWEFGRPTGSTAARRWDFAHRMPTVGDGYVWPNITIFSDGIRAFVHSRQSSAPGAVLFRFLGAARREEVSTLALEEAIDAFANDVLSRLEADGLRETNLHRLWDDLQNERDDPELARYRKLEALLGYDPDEADEDAVRQRLHDAAALGEEAMGELAADATLDDDPLKNMAWSRDLSDIAERRGFDADLRAGFSLTDATDMPRPGAVQAWRLGEQLARDVRRQAALDGERISNDLLATFAGTTAAAISGTGRRSRGLSFALNRRGACARVALRSRYVTGRRFELARLFGDRLAYTQVDGLSEDLSPATRSYSYRQKMQRAFAAELLSPFAAVDDMLRGDYSDENQGEVAAYFKVAPMTVRSQLVDHGRIRPEDAPDIVGRGAAFQESGTI